MSKSQFSIRSLLFVMLSTGAACLSVSILLSGFSKHAGVKKQNQTALLANRDLWQEHQLPGNATQVSYFVDFGTCEVYCHMSKPQFLRWCNSKRWVVSKINTPTNFEFDYLGVKSVIVSKGFSFSPTDGEGLYDEQAERLYFRVSTFP